jgi:hypothetical protein
MFTRTITTTPLQELALAAVVAERNAENDGPPITADDYFQVRVSEVLQSYAASRVDPLIDRAIADLFTRPPEVQGAVITALGLAGVPPGVLPGILADGVGRTRFLALTPDQQNALVSLVYPAR